MKTVYAHRFHYGNSRIVISDKALGLAEQAVQRVQEVSQEHAWRPSIEIDLPRYRGDPLNTGGVMIRVERDEGVVESSHDAVTRAILEKHPTRAVRVDLGEHGPESWDSFTDREHLLQLPDVYFSDGFLSTMMHSYLEKPNFRVVEEAHWPMLVRRIYDTAKTYSRNCKSHRASAIANRDKDYYKRLREHYQKVMEAATHAKTGKNLEQLMQAIQAKPQQIPVVPSS